MSVKVLVRRVSNADPTSWQAGDVVDVIDSASQRQFGSAINYHEYVARFGNDAGFNTSGPLVVIEFADLLLADCQHWQEPDSVLDESGEHPIRTLLNKSGYTLDFESLERREPGSGRDTLRTQLWIQRSWADPETTTGQGTFPPPASTLSKK